MGREEAEVVEEREEAIARASKGLEEQEAAARTQAVRANAQELMTVLEDAWNAH